MIIQFLKRNFINIIISNIKENRGHAYKSYRENERESRNINRMKKDFHKLA